MDQDWEIINNDTKSNKSPFLKISTCNEVDKIKDDNIILEFNKIDNEINVEEIDKIEDENIDESEADKILEAPLEIVKNLKESSTSIISSDTKKKLTNKIIKSSVLYVLSSEKLWLNASIVALKCYGDIDWRINCICLTINAGIILFKHRKLINNIRTLIV